jgi:hypothetical protein
MRASTRDSIAVSALKFVRVWHASFRFTQDRSFHILTSPSTIRGDETLRIM